MLNAPNDTELIAPKTSTHNSQTQNSETQSSKLKTDNLKSSQVTNPKTRNPTTQNPKLFTMSSGPIQCSSCLTSAYALPDAPV